MSRPRTKKFDFATDVYYFNIKKGYRSEIIIKRTSKDKAMQAFQYYLKAKSGESEWLGKWDGSKFVETNFDKLVSTKTKAALL